MIETTKKTGEDDFTSIEKNLSILLEALDAALPFCKRAGVEVVIGNSYDEWENIVQQYFDSLVLGIVEFEKGTHTISSFKKLGAVRGKNSYRNVICAEYEGKPFFIDDIVSYDGLSNSIEWVGCSSAQKTNSYEKKNIMSLEKFKNFSIAKI